MKRILLLLFSLITTAAIGQYPINQILSSDSTMVSVGRNATGGIRGGLVNMVFADTTAANLSRISYYTGAQIWTTTDSAIWVRFKGTPSFWVKMAGASGGTTGSFWNITGNYFGGGVPLNYGVGTNSYDYLPLKTNNITRLLIPPDGILRSSAPANKYLMMDTTTLEMYYGDGGGGSGWSLTGNTGIDTTNFIGTIDSVPFIIRTHNQFSGTVGSYITGYDNSVITTGNFPYRHGLISLGIGAAKSLPLNNTGGIVVIGTDALKNLHNSSVSNNYAANGLVVIGTNAYKYLDSSFYPYGNRSTVIGHWAGHRNFAGEYNTIVGAMNMELNYRGSNNTSIGFSTLRSNIDGGGNVAMGLFSMLYNSTGIDTIPLISGGSGYTYANVTISAPLAGSPGGYVQTATATADVSGGAVTAIRMTNKGAGYSIYPHTYDFGTQGNIVVTITGDGTGATAGTPVMISGNDNTCIGTGSGFYNIRGKGNVNVGNSSSNKTDDNYTTLVGFGTSTNSPSGKISKAGAIGYNAKVGASNSLVLGGTGADTVNVGIDVEKPLARLHIASGNIVAQGTTEEYPSTHYLPFSGIGARFMWVNSKRAIRAGYVTDNKWDIDSIAHGSVAFGYYTGAMGYGSLAQGEYAYARGKAALAVGWQVDANADFSVALGAGNKCYGSWSTSFGLNNIANSNISLATGYGTIAYYGASTFGIGTRGKGFYSFATGIGNYSKNYGGAAFGTYNDTTDVGSISAIDNANRIFVVGNGTADNARSNALTILQTGKVGIGTTSPDSLLTVSQGIYGQRGLRLPNLPTGKKAKQLYWDTDGTVYVADSTVGGGGGGGGLTIGTTTIANSATGSILYDSSGILSRNADLYWDVSNKRLGIGTSTPTALTHLISTTEQLRIGYDASNYYKTTVGSTGGVTFDAVGSGSQFSFSDNVNVTGTGNVFYGRWKARVDSTTSSATPTINTDNVDVFKITALAAAITSMTTNLSGTPNDGDILELVITDNGTARAITWGASFVSTTVTLPSTTTLGVTLTVVLQYYKSSSYGNNKWHCVNYY